MIRIVTIGGSGDAYMICALFDAFRLAHGRADVVLAGRAKYRAIADLFGTPWEDRDDLVDHAHANVEFQRTHENVLIAPEATFYAHPCFLRSEIRVDKLTTKIDASQADMYRMILRVPLDAPLSVPTRLPDVAQVPDTVLVIPEAISWPNTQPAFWTMLRDDLRRIGRTVNFNDPQWSFGQMLRECASYEWVIGPQCGVMSILCTGRFPCRKTLASARLDDGNKKLAFLSARTFPYAYVTKFSNADYAVEEFEITDNNHAELVASIVNGVNAQRARPHDPAPVMTIQAPLSPGDFLDRLAVLEVKYIRFGWPRRAEVEREYRRFQALRTIYDFPPAADEVYSQMVALHDRTFSLLADLVPAALGGSPSVEGHTEAMRLNRDRVVLKRRVDECCRAPYTEGKSYHD